MPHDICVEQYSVLDIFMGKGVRHSEITHVCPESNSLKWELDMLVDLKETRNYAHNCQLSVLVVVMIPNMVLPFEPRSGRCIWASIQRPTRGQRVKQSPLPERVL